MKSKLIFSSLAKSSIVVLRTFSVLIILHSSFLTNIDSGFYAPGFIIDEKGITNAIEKLSKLTSEGKKKMALKCYENYIEDSDFYYKQMLSIGGELAVK